MRGSREIKTAEAERGGEGCCRGRQRAGSRAERSLETVIATTQSLPGLDQRWSSHPHMELGTKGIFLPLGPS